ncbi:MAG: bactofilin family protein [Bacteroidota bacterium]|nr:polymer-forming cytoskeletal protein [Kiloniellaceae bacterium]
MTSSNQPRRPMPAPEPGLGVRPGAGVLGLARAEPPASRDAAADGTLHVGEGIQLKGEIQACKTLIVEGRVEASLDAGELSVRRGGCYDGTATVGAARIGGSFSGTLTVNGLLTVEACGRVSGTLRYRELRIEQGGRISGDVDLVAEETRARANGKAAAGERLIMEGAAAR